MSSIKVSALTAKTTPSGSEELLINDGGVSKKITIANLPDTNTTYSVGDGGLTEVNFTTADNSKLDAIEASATADQTAGEIEAIVTHDNLLGFVANEHIDWTADQGATNLHAGNYTDTNTTYVSSDFNHDSLTGFVANEHIDWTTDQGATNVHAGNYTDTDTVYTHPNHSGDVTSTADGATVISAGAVDIAMLSATGTAAGTTFLRGDNTWVVPTDTNTDTKWDGGTTGLTAATGRTSLGLVIGTDVQAYDADTTKNDVANTFTATQTLKGITETEATSSASTYTIDLSLGTLFEVTNASLCTVTMPTAAAGKSFTVIATVPAAWSGTILWSGGAAPSTGSAKTIYSFVSNGSSWYGMQAGTGFA